MDAKKEIQQIKERNKKVEADKAWETSTTRKVIIAGLTYLVIVLFLYTLNLPNPLINAIIPTVGFLLSTLTLSFLKKFWVEKIYKK